MLLWEIESKWILVTRDFCHISCVQKEKSNRLRRSYIFIKRKIPLSCPVCASSHTDKTREKMKFCRFCCLWFVEKLRLVFFNLKYNLTFFIIKKAILYLWNNSKFNTLIALKNPMTFYHCDCSSTWKLVPSNNWLIIW